MANKEKQIGESKLLGQIDKKFTFKISKDAITTDKIKDDAVTEEKISQELRDKINRIRPIISLGFYHDDDPPTPMLMLAVRPACIDEVVVPYLLLAQEDISERATAWKWERNSFRPDLDIGWNNSPKALERVLNLTNADFPAGWEHQVTVNMSFKCTVDFLYEGEEFELINVITII